MLPCDASPGTPSLSGLVTGRASELPDAILAAGTSALLMGVVWPPVSCWLLLPDLAEVKRLEAAVLRLDQDKSLPNGMVTGASGQGDDGSSSVVRARHSATGGHRLLCMQRRQVRQATTTFGCLSDGDDAQQVRRVWLWKASNWNERASCGH